MSQAQLRRSRRRRTGAEALISILALAALAGCRGERTLRLTSTPVGAEVRLDGQPVGVTPVEIEIDHYGTRSLTMYRSGYRLYSEPLELKARWWSYFPIDIFTEILNPIRIHDRREVHTVLDPATGEVAEPVTASFIEEAIQVRSEARGQAEAGQQEREQPGTSEASVTATAAPDGTGR